MFYFFFLLQVWFFNYKYVQQFFNLHECAWIQLKERAPENLFGAGGRDWPWPDSARTVDFSITPSIVVDFQQRLDQIYHILKIENC